MKMTAFLSLLVLSSNLYAGTKALEGIDFYSPLEISPDELISPDDVKKDAADKNDEWWKEINFGVMELSVYAVNKNSCPQNQLGLSGCVNAINTVLAYSDKRLVLIPKKIALQDNANTVPEKEFENLWVVDRAKYPAPILPENMDIYQQWKKVEERRLAILSALQEMINDGSAKKIYYTTLVDYAHSMMKDKTKIYLAAAGALNAFLEQAVDAHAYFTPRKKFTEETQATEQNYLGVGILADFLVSKVVIRKVYFESPAHRAGLLPQDEIIEVNGVTFPEILKEAVYSQAFDKSNEVQIKVKRKDKSLTFNLIKEKVVNKIVYSQTIKQKNESLLYVNLSTFISEKACELVNDEIGKVKQKLQSTATPLKGIILDLRGNPGGLLTQATCISGSFIGKNKKAVRMGMLPQFKQQNVDDKWYNTPETGEDFSGLKVAVLVDANSASASEILAGLMQEKEKAIIVGERTYGKGSVQNIFEAQISEHVYMAMTTARYYFPSGVTPQRTGVSPDIEAYQLPVVTEEQKFRIREVEDHPTTLPNDGAPVTQSFARKQVLANVKSCVAQGKAAKIYDEKTEDVFLDPLLKKDYQVLVARDTLDCLLK